MTSIASARRPASLLFATLCALGALLIASTAHAKRCPEGVLCSEIGPEGYTERQTGFIFPKDFFDKQSGVEITGDEAVDYKNLAAELGTGVSYSGVFDVYCGNPPFRSSAMGAPIR